VVYINFETFRIVLRDMSKKYLSILIFISMTEKYYCTNASTNHHAGGRINFLRRKSSDLFGEIFAERNSFIEDGSNFTFYEEILIELK